MSASLVGSEMCIRDRNAPVRRGRFEGICEAPALRPTKVFGQPIEGAGVPVSYTHLTLPTICSV
eukprot:11347108-Alexandrium_andersonii.AAC.1